MNDDIMVDLETVDTRSSAAILSIGACKVHWGGDEPSDHFYRVISLDSCRAVGLTESPDTMAWWAKQGDEARRVFTDPSVTLDQALVDFHHYLSQFGRSTVRVWGNGSDFDNAILANAYDKIGLDLPWRFYNNRCYRTIKSTFKGHFVEPSRAGTHHNALDDALHQARGLSSIRHLIR